MTSTLKPYKSYLFRDKDPVIDLMRTAIADAGIKHVAIERAGGPTSGTLHNWFKGTTRRPSFAAANAAMRVIGKEFILTNYHRTARRKRQSR